MNRLLADVVDEIAALPEMPPALLVELRKAATSHRFAAPELQWRAWERAASALNSWADEIPCSDRVAAIFSGESR